MTAWPGRLGRILTDLTRAGRAHTGIGSPAASPWLFPGGMPGQPVTLSRLGERLRAIGVRALPGRRAAMTDLAAQLPATVLADLLNITRTPPSAGCTRQEPTGTATSPRSPEPAITSHDE